MNVCLMKKEEKNYRFGEDLVIWLTTTAREDRRNEDTTMFGVLWEIQKFNACTQKWVVYTSSEPFRCMHYKVYETNPDNLYIV